MTEQLRFEDSPEIIKAIDEIHQLSLLESFLAAQLRDVRERKVELLAYIDDRRVVYEHQGINPPTYQPRVGSADRIAGQTAHQLTHGLFNPKGIFRGFRSKIY